MKDHPLTVNVLLREDDLEVMVIVLLFFNLYSHYGEEIDAKANDVLERIETAFARIEELRK